MILKDLPCHDISDTNPEEESVKGPNYGKLNNIPFLNLLLCFLYPCPFIDQRTTRNASTPKCVSNEFHTDHMWEGLFVDGLDLPVIVLKTPSQDKPNRIDGK